MPFVQDMALPWVPTTVSLDPLAIGRIALASLTRGYTAEECATYDIDPCPTTLEQVVERYGGSA